MSARSVPIDEQAVIDGGACGRVRVWADVLPETTCGIAGAGGTAMEDWSHMRSEMLVSTERLGGLPLVIVRGEIDHGSAAGLQETIDTFLDSGDTVILLDLGDVTYIDSGGISVLLSTVRRLRKNGWLAAVGPNANVRRLLEIVGLKVDQGFRLFDDRETAAAAAQKMVGS